MRRRDTKLAMHKGRYFCRSIGVFVNGRGNLDEKKFLLGTDRKAAEIASLRLAQLWDEVVAATQRDNAARLRRWQEWTAAGVSLFPLDGLRTTGDEWEAGCAEYDPDRPPAARSPVWTEDTLAIADAIRRGDSQVTLAPLRCSKVRWPEHPRSYVERLGALRENHPGIRVVPESPETFTAGQVAERQVAGYLAAEAASISAAAAVAIPAGAGQTLYQALERYAAWVQEEAKR